MRNALANCRRTIVPVSATVPNGLNQNAEKFPLDCTIFEAHNSRPSGKRSIFRKKTHGSIHGMGPNRNERRLGLLALQLDCRNTRA
jgi:hypothetical protein